MHNTAKDDQILDELVARGGRDLTRPADRAEGVERVNAVEV